MAPRDTLESGPLVSGTIREYIPIVVSQQCQADPCFMIATDLGQAQETLGGSGPLTTETNLFEVRAV